MWYPLILSLALSSPAVAGSDGLKLAIYVADGAGVPIPTAVIRHVEEGDRHAVNRRTGGWMADRLYLAEGQELVFERGSMLEFEISAPGYETAHVIYSMRKRKNRLTVTLAQMEELVNDSEDVDPVIQFFRDKPIEHDASGPAH
ncbi:MAG: hypothetical protein JXX28_04555 [Deltaproteobacteria bacterium]|nr:hypothetical protein [Deltaproteobacteria bacterium]